LEKFRNWKTEGVLLSPWRRLLPELLFSHLFKPVVKEFVWDVVIDVKKPWENLEIF